MGLFSALLPGSIGAQEDAEGDVSDGGEAGRRLHLLEQEIARERERADASLMADLETIRGLEQDRRALAERLVDRQFRRKEVAARRQELDEARRTSERERSALAAAHLELMRAAQGMAEQIEAILAELPGWPVESAELARIDGLLSVSSPDGSTMSGVAELLAIGDRVHQAMMRVVLEVVEVRTVGGLAETVDLLSLGVLAHYYRAAPDRLAVALASPRDAAGYRWTETLPPGGSRSIGDAMDQLRDGPAGLLIASLPFDVTGKVRGDSVMFGDDTLSRLRSGGPVMLPIFLVATLAFTLILERAWVLQRQGGGFREGMASVLVACREGRGEAAELLCRAGRGVVPRTLAACLRRRREGESAMEVAAQEQLLHELPRLQRFLGGIAVLGSVAPLLGLLGTVTGMIRTFGAIQEHGRMGPGLLAAGISEALLTTAAGLAVAIPILLLHSLLSGRVDRALGEAERGATTLIRAVRDSEQDEAVPTRRDDRGG
jgi:biopolymer transport protein ExbB